MTYDLTNPLHRKQFVKRANAMLNRNCTAAVLEDKSQRSINQNRYLHVLCRILAVETGVTEKYAKDTYFKSMANHDLFTVSIIDPITGEEKYVLRSSSTLSVQEMNVAIANFRRWSEDNGYYLPDATIDSDGKVTFNNEADTKAFQQAELETDRMATFLQ